MYNALLTYTLTLGTKGEVYLTLFPFLTPPENGTQKWHKETVVGIPLDLFQGNGLLSKVTTRMLQLLNCEKFRWSGGANPPVSQPANQHFICFVRVLQGLLC